MNLKQSALAISTSLILSCTIECFSQERYFDYSGKDGCSPANIGHRLGGDLSQFDDNTIAGMHGITDQQNSQCFKNWEFDLSEWRGDLYLSHDSIISNESAISLVSISDFQKEFNSIEVSKPIIIDLKTISSTSGLEKIMPFALSLRSAHSSDIWFLISPDNTRVLNKICRIVSGQFDVMLYRRGGKYCD